MRRIAVSKGSPLPDSDRSADAQLLFDVVRQAANSDGAWRRWRSSAWTKPDGSQVTEGDLAINALFEEELRPKRDYAWLSEETPDDHARLKSRRLWIIDPIDGTSAFIQQRHEWCVAAALVRERQARHRGGVPADQGRVLHGNCGRRRAAQWRAARHSGFG